MSQRANEANGGVGNASPRRFEHLNGVRCLAAFWIVCAHYMPRSLGEEIPGSFLNQAYYRVNVAVCYFVVVSGFVTHWTSANLTGSVVAFYARRLGRVLLSFWLAMAWAVYLQKRQGEQLPMDYVVKCFCLVEQWFKWCPNGPSWFVFALLPSWLLYPLSRKLVACAEERAAQSGLLLLLLASFLASTGPGVVLFVMNGNITMQQHNDMMFWPPSQLADFMLGMTTAAMVRRCPQGTRFRGLADLSFLLLLLVVFLLPRPSRTYEMHLNGWEPLLDHALAPVVAAFILGSCADDVPGWSVRLLSHSALVSLGDVSFQVYIFQRPVRDTLRLVVSTDRMDVFMAYMISLWIFACIYKVCVEDPVDKQIKRCIARWRQDGSLEEPADVKDQEYGLLSQRPSAA